VAAVAAAFALAVSLMQRVTGESFRELARAFGPALIPVAAAYTVTHYLSLLVLDGQTMFIRISDPLGRGDDWFGTVDYSINWELLTPTQLAWTQVVAIAVGHVLAVVVAHDRALERYSHDVAVRSQYPVLLLMIGYSVAALSLLLGS